MRSMNIRCIYYSVLLPFFISYIIFYIANNRQQTNLPFVVIVVTTQRSVFAIGLAILFVERHERTRANTLRRA